MSGILDLRAAAATATKDAVLGKPFAWFEMDCAKVASAHLKRLGWDLSFSRVGTYSSERGALRAMRRLGYADLDAFVDTARAIADASLLLQRCGYARVMAGDIVALPGPGMMALTIAMGDGRLLGFHPDARDRAAIFALNEALIPQLVCWSANPCLLS